jgi:hypothetical protein
MAAETWAGIGHVRNVDYDAAAESLTVLFENGRRYRYHKVAYEDWNALMQADSKGSYLRRSIQPRHRFEEVKA